MSCRPDLQVRREAASGERQAAKRQAAKRQAAKRQAASGKRQSGKRQAAVGGGSRHLDDAEIAEIGAAD
jgi:hypothetical protein